MSATSEWWSEAYPARYYAYPNTSSLLGGYPSVGWIDISIYSKGTTWIPAASDMIALTPEEWASRGLGSQIIKDGAVQAYVAPVETVPLKTQASTALSAVRILVYNNYGILNESTPSAWVTYLKALAAIADGTDTTSTTLPTQPTDVTTSAAAT